jgi:hypothetical protein
VENGNGSPFRATRKGLARSSAAVVRTARYFGLERIALRIVRTPSSSDGGDTARDLFGSQLDSIQGRQGLHLVTGAEPSCFQYVTPMSFSIIG